MLIRVYILFDITVSNIVSERVLFFFYYSIFLGFVNLKLLYFLLLSLYRRLIARCCLSRLTAYISGCCRSVGLICKSVLLTVGFKLLFLLLEFISRLVKTLFVAESVKAGA